MDNLVTEPQKTQMNLSRWLDNVVKIEQTSYTSYAIKSDGAVWAWGYNVLANLGVDTTTNYSLVPVQVHVLTNAKDIAASKSHTIAIQVDESLWEWGMSNYLGTNKVPSKIPIPLDFYLTSQPLDPATFIADVTGSTNGSVSVTINYPAKATVLQYKIGDDQVWESYSSPIVFTENGSIHARTQDAAGN